MKKDKRRTLAQHMVQGYVARGDDFDFDIEATQHLKDDTYASIVAEIRKANVVLVWGNR